MTQYNFERNPEKTRWLRPDTLSQCLSFANVQSGGKYLLVDGVGGLLAGAILDRMGGSGQLFAVHDADSPPPFELMPLFNLTQSHIQPVLRTLHWAATEKRWMLPSHMSDELSKVYKSEREKNRAKRKRAGIEDFIKTREQFFAGQFDAYVQNT